ncbi:hypothetical protein BC826DRAFT_973176 [Russula brevipes]|nr:hypothetical protein BC826DRAFT_973176 [Russula brevipes]
MSLIAFSDGSLPHVKIQQCRLRDLPLMKIFGTPFRTYENTPYVTMGMLPATLVIAVVPLDSPRFQLPRHHQPFTDRCPRRTSWTIQSWLTRKMVHTPNSGIFEERYEPPRAEKTSVDAEKAEPCRDIFASPPQAKIKSEKDAIPPVEENEPRTITPVGLASFSKDSSKRGENALEEPADKAVAPENTLPSPSDGTSSPRAT